MHSCPGKIFSLIPLIMADVGAVKKSRSNVQQGYSFRGIDDLYNAIHDALVKHGVFIVPVVIDRVQQDRESKRGGCLIYTSLVVSHKFYGPDGSYIEAVTVGEAMDSGDKSSNKAMSAAMKYAIIETFAIPTGDEADTENESHEIVKKKPAESTQPTLDAVEKF